MGDDFDERGTSFSAGCRRFRTCFTTEGFREGDVKIRAEQGIENDPESPGGRGVRVGGDAEAVRKEGEAG